MSGEETQSNVQATGGPAHDYGEYARFGISSYLVLGIGVFLTYLLTYFLFDEDSVLYSFSAEEESLYYAAETTFELLPFIAPLLAFALAYYYWHTDEVSSELYQPAAIASLLGALVLGLVLVLLMVMFEPEGMDVGFGEELPGLIGIVIATAIVGAGGGVVAENVWE